MPLVVTAERPSSLVTPSQEPGTTAFLALLEPVMTFLEHGLQVLRVPEQIAVAPMRGDVVDGIGHDLLVFVMRALAIRMPLELPCSQPLPCLGFVPSLNALSRFTSLCHGEENVLCFNKLWG
ncbi:MAG: hypothetical protein RIB80_04695 [Rhodospirillales bacterium]